MLLLVCYSIIINLMSRHKLLEIFTKPFIANLWLPVCINGLNIQSNLNGFTSYNY